MTMPTLDKYVINSYLQDNDYCKNHLEQFMEIVSLITKNNGVLRSGKPKVSEDKPRTGEAAFVWRNLVFFVSPKRIHQHMPVTSDFDLPAFDENGKWCSSIAREQATHLMKLVDVLIDCVPKYQWHGIRTWGRALGY